MNTILCSIVAKHYVLIMSSHCTILYNIILLFVLILSVTLSTTQTYFIIWKSTEYGNYDIAHDIVWSISYNSIDCYNTLTWYGTYVNGTFTDYYYSSTYSTCSSHYYTNTNTMYISTSQGYTYVSDISTLTNTITNHYFETILYTNCNIMTETDVLIKFSTDIQYSTITRIEAPSPSIVPKCEFTCNVQSCNNIDLFILLYTLLYKCN
jgi:hypothetical protein